MGDRFLVIRYEDMQANTHANLKRVVAFLEWDVPADLLNRAVAASSKDGMAKKDTVTVDQPVVNRRKKHPFEYYSEEDRAFFSSTVQHYVNNTFGYEFDDWQIPAAVNCESKTKVASIRERLVHVELHQGKRQAAPNRKKVAV